MLFSSFILCTLTLEKKIRFYSYIQQSSKIIWETKTQQQQANNKEIHSASQPASHSDKPRRTRRGLQKRQTNIQYTSGYKNTQSHSIESMRLCCIQHHKAIDRQRDRPIATLNGRTTKRQPTSSKISATFFFIVVNHRLNQTKTKINVYYLH